MTVQNPCRCVKGGGDFNAPEHDEDCEWYRPKTHPLAGVPQPLRTAVEVFPRLVENTNAATGEAYAGPVLVQTHGEQLTVSLGQLPVMPPETAGALARSLLVTLTAHLGEATPVGPPRIQRPTAPMQQIMYCPMCGARHVDRGRFATKPHHTHSCQTCGHTWRPAVEDTVGVEFLPGFKDDPLEPPGDFPTERDVLAGLLGWIRSENFDREFEGADEDGSVTVARAIEQILNGQRRIPPVRLRMANADTAAVLGEMREAARTLPREVNRVRADVAADPLANSIWLEAVAGDPGALEAVVARARELGTPRRG